MALVADAGCVMCRYLATQQQGRTYLHHAREGQGMGQRGSDWLVVGLCYRHHQGADGWHTLGKRAFYGRYQLDEMDLLAMAIEGAAMKGLRE